MHSHTLALVGRLGRGKRLPRLPARKPVSLLLRQLGKVGRHAPRVVTREQNHCRPPPRYWLRMGGIILRQSKKKDLVGEPHSSLTEREREIALLVTRGLRNKAIASELQCSEGTVKVHLHNIGGLGTLKTLASGYGGEGCQAARPPNHGLRSLRSASIFHQNSTDSHPGSASCATCMFCCND